MKELVLIAFGAAVASYVLSRRAKIAKLESDLNNARELIKAKGISEADAKSE